jgi:ABC-type phosphate/phosphonate transport system permease subunit
VHPENARNALNPERNVVGTVGGGRIGCRLLQHIKPFDHKGLLYCVLLLQDESQM